MANDRENNRAWMRDAKARELIYQRKQAGNMHGLRDVRAQKGMGPNKACGHKGGICRQGSKRG